MVNTWDVKPELPATLSTLAWTKASGSHKVTMAMLKAKYTTPTAAFSATPLTGDAPLMVAFTDESTGAPTSWAWDFNNDGTTDSTSQSPSYTYTSPGTYTVKLTVSNALGSDDETKTGYITVKTPAPVADFTYTPASGAAPLTVAFTDASTGVVNSYAWDFNNDGTTDSTLQNPSYTYTTAGIYSVKLTVTGPDYSNSVTKDNIISVGVATISVNVDPASIDFGTMIVGDETGSTAVTVTTDGGTAWSVTAADGKTTDKGYMTSASNKLANAFQLANGGGGFQAMTSNFANFMTGTPNEDRTDTANVKQVIAPADQPGSYSITLTFTGGFA
jgi:PKD repeat protein